MTKAAFSVRQKTFRGRNDDVTLNSTTWNGGGGANNANWTQSDTTNFRIRFVLQEYTGGSGNKTYHLYYSHNGGTYTQVTASSSVVRVVDSTQFADGDATTQLLDGTGTFVAGVGDDSDAVMPSSGNISLGANENSEVEINLKIQSADVSNSDTIAFRVRYSTGVLEDYANTPTVTVSKSASFAVAQNKYRFYLDGTESGSNPLAGENENVVRKISTENIFHLRLLLQETGGGAGASTDDYQLQYQRNGGTWTNITSSSAIIKGYDSSSLTDTGATTNRATNGITDGTGSFVAGKISEDGLLDDWQLTANNFSEILYSLQVNTDAAMNDVVDFRVLYNGATMTYNVTPRLRITKNPTNKSSFSI